jgi:ribosomal protein S27E
VAPLDVSLRKRLVSLLNTVQCNGQQAYSTAYLVGLGAPTSLLTSWGVGWSSLETKIKYFQSTSDSARQQLSTYDADFGVVSDGLSAESQSQMSDAVLAPLAAYAMAPGTHASPDCPSLSHASVITSLTLTCVLCAVCGHRVLRSGAGRPRVGARL